MISALGHPLAVASIIGVVTVLADVLVKRASDAAVPFREGAFWWAMAIYGATVFPWVYVLRHAKLATIGAWYSVAVVVMLALVGVVLFRESLSARELLGLGCAIAALVLLGRVA